MASGQPLEIVQRVMPHPVDGLSVAYKTFVMCWLLSPLKMVFLKLVHTESQVNYKTQRFWIKMVHLVSNVQTLAGHAVGTIHLAPKTKYPPFRHSTKNQVSFHSRIEFFIFLQK